MVFEFAGKTFEKWPEIIEYGLTLIGPDQDEFVEAVAKIGPYALQNIGYMSGYYDTKTADRIMEVFKTSHPIFGRRHPDPAEAFEKGYEMAAGKKWEPPA